MKIKLFALFTFFGLFAQAHPTFEISSGTLSSAIRLCSSTNMLLKINEMDARRGKVPTPEQAKSLVDALTYEVTITKLLGKVEGRVQISGLTKKIGDQVVEVALVNSANGLIDAEGVLTVFPGVTTRLVLLGGAICPYLGDDTSPAALDAAIERFVTDNFKLLPN